jgi:hypothetical protein
MRGTVIFEADPSLQLELSRLDSAGIIHGQWPSGFGQ